MTPVAAMGMTLRWQIWVDTCAVVFDRSAMAAIEPAPQYCPSVDRVAAHLDLQPAEAAQTICKLPERSSLVASSHETPTNNAFEELSGEDIGIGDVGMLVLAAKSRKVNYGALHTTLTRIEIILRKKGLLREGTELLTAREAIHSRRVPPQSTVGWIESLVEQGMPPKIANVLARSYEAIVKDAAALFGK